MRHLFTCLLSFAFVLVCHAQSAHATVEKSAELSTNVKLKHVNHYPIDVQPEKASDVVALRVISSFKLAIPDRLPMFCALEKKLAKACNLWIKIRLPENR